MAFVSTLKKIRKDLGFLTVRSFYSHISSLGVLGFNYSYYARIENGETFPSPKVISKLAFILPKYSEQLVLAYCKVQFPKQQHLFESNVSLEIADLKTKQINYKQQDELNLRQVTTIGKSKTHYFLFLILTLSRRRLMVNELEKIFKDRKITSAIEDLHQVEIIHIEGDALYSVSHEMKFPVAHNDSLRKLYGDMDLWDYEFSKVFKFEELKKKFFLRRVSPRFIGVINHHIELLLETIVLSDEVQYSMNEEVISLSINVSRGKLPG